MAFEHILIETFIPVCDGGVVGNDGKSAQTPALEELVILFFNLKSPLRLSYCLHFGGS